MQGLSFKAYQDKERIGVKDKIWKLWKSCGLYKDYGNNFSKVWLEDYTFVLVSLFRTTTPHLQTSLTQFYGIILQLLKVYD